MYLVDKLKSLVTSRGNSYPYELWSSQLDNYELWRYYYDGTVFDQLTDPTDAESPLRFPLRINLAASLVEIQSSYLWGQWSDDVVKWRVDPLPHGRERPSDNARETAERLENALGDIWRMNDHNAMLDRASMDFMIDGGIYFKLSYDIFTSSVKVEPVLAQYVFPRWHPTNFHELLELVIAYQLPKDDARILYGTEGSSWGDWCLYWERWTPTKWEASIDDVVIRNEANRWGFIPIEYVPRNRTGTSYYGSSVIEGIRGLQDEVNGRLADVGEGINYYAHPIRWVRDYRGNVDLLPVGPDVVWDLGQTLGTESPMAGVLDATGNYTSVQQFANLLLSLSQDASHTPPVALGRDEGSQRSAMTLALRMLPLTQQTVRSRMHWDSAFRRMGWKMLQMESLMGTLAFDAETIRKHYIKTLFAPILPKDRMQLVEENIRLTDSGLRHPIDALKSLGAEDAEQDWEKIYQWLQERKELGIAVQKSTSVRSTT